MYKELTDFGEYKHREELSTPSFTFILILSHLTAFMVGGAVMATIIGKQVGI